MSRLLAWLDRLQRGHIALAFPVAVLKKFGDDRASRLAALIAYYAFFSLFPLLLAFVSILGFVLDNDPQLRGPRFHTAMHELRTQGWLATGPFGYVVLDREASEHFLRTRSAIFPGMKIAEIFGVTEGPLYEEMRRNILHINGADHTRLRSLVNPALSPRAVERYRPVMRGFLQGLLEQARAAPSLHCEFVEAFAKPYPSQVIASVMGARRLEVGFSLRATTSRD